MRDGARRAAQGDIDRDLLHVGVEVEHFDRRALHGDVAQASRRDREVEARPVEGRRARDAGEFRHGRQVVDRKAAVPQAAPDIRHAGRHRIVRRDVGGDGEASRLDRPRVDVGRHPAARRRPDAERPQAVQPGHRHVGDRSFRAEPVDAGVLDRGARELKPRPGEIDGELLHVDDGPIVAKARFQPRAGDRRAPRQYSWELNLTLARAKADAKQPEIAARGRLPFDLPAHGDIEARERRERRRGARQNADVNILHPRDDMRPLAWARILQCDHGPTRFAGELQAEAVQMPAFRHVEMRASGKGHPDSRELLELRQGAGDQRRLQPVEIDPPADAAGLAVLKQHRRQLSSGAAVLHDEVEAALDHRRAKHRDHVGRGHGPELTVELVHIAHLRRQNGEAAEIAKGALPFAHDAEQRSRGIREGHRLALRVSAAGGHGEIEAAVGVALQDGAQAEDVEPRDTEVAAQQTFGGKADGDLGQQGDEPAVGAVDADVPAAQVEDAPPAAPLQRGILDLDRKRRVLEDEARLDHRCQEIEGDGALGEAPGEEAPDDRDADGAGDEDLRHPYDELVCDCLAPPRAYLVV